MKKILIMMLAVMLLCAPCLTVHAEGLQIKAKAWILIDAGSGNVLSENNADEPMECAGVVKTMSMLLIFDAVKTGRISLTEPVTVSEKAASMGGTQVFLDVNTSHTVENLIKAMVICSANDATVALAEKVAGSEDAFVEMMNKKAEVMGLVGRFTNATGLGTDKTLTARDVATVCQTLADYDLYYTWSNIYMENYVHPDGRETEMVNQNRLIRFYEGCDGFATGSTPTAGYCLAASVKRSGGRFLFVSLGSANSSARFDDAKAAFDYAFAGFTAKAIVREGQQLAKNLPVTGGATPYINAYAAADFSALIEKGKENTLEKELVLLEDIAAPVKEGQVLGYLSILLDGEEIGRVDVISKEDVEVLDFGNALGQILKRWLFS
jgi:D-alanyl-D-alanine carboxypeptidase (penicillin-binding protein 5/6)